MQTHESLPTHLFIHHPQGFFSPVRLVYAFSPCQSPRGNPVYSQGLPLTTFG